jgi:hypothetical protein
MRDGVAFFLLLVVRGLLLWIVLPVAALAWFVRLPYALLRRRRVSIGQTLGWADLNLIACLEASLLRPIMRERSSFVRWHDAASVSHRPSLLDPA